MLPWKKPKELRRVIQTMSPEHIATVFAENAGQAARTPFVDLANFVLRTYDDNECWREGVRFRDTLDTLLARKDAQPIRWNYDDSSGPVPQSLDDALEMERAKGMWKHTYA